MRYTANTSKSWDCHLDVANDDETVDLPSGKQPHNYGKSQFLMGKSTINGHFQ